MTMRENILTICFLVVVAINIVVTIRYLMMMRQMNAALKTFIEANRQFAELLDEQQNDRSRPIAPTDP